MTGRPARDISPAEALCIWLEHLSEEQWLELADDRRDVDPLAPMVSDDPWFNEQERKWAERVREDRERERRGEHE